jgi:hypothetical protein
MNPVYRMIIMTIHIRGKTIKDIAPVSKYSNILIPSPTWPGNP